MRAPHFFQSTRFLILALVACCMAALISVALISGAGIDHVNGREDDPVLSVAARIGAAHVLKSAAIQEVLAVRDFALTGERNYLAVASTHSTQFERTLALLNRPGGRPLDNLLLQEIIALEARFDGLRDRVVGLRQAQQSLAARALLLNQGGPLADRLINRLDALILRQEQELADAHAQVNRNEERIMKAFVAVSLIGLPLTLLLGGLVLWRVIRPLRELEAASRAIADGRLAVRVEPRRDDEFGEVSSAFNVMAEKVEQALTRLQEANAELTRLDSYKDEFLSIVSHELRTPLSFIKGFAGVLDKEIAGPLNPEQHQYVENIVSGADRMLFLVNDLLDLATIQAGKLTLERVPQPLAPLVREALMSMQPLATDKHIQLESVLEGGATPPVDQQRILQVLTNLLANAIKFTPQGGFVAVWVIDRGDTVRVEVRDTGPGIAPEDQLRLFQRFSQLDMSATRKASGTGLGLSISKALIEAHGGHIGVASLPGKGATFWFELPALA